MCLRIGYIHFALLPAMFSSSNYPFLSLDPYFLRDSHNPVPVSHGLEQSPWFLPFTSPPSWHLPALRSPARGEQAGLRPGCRAWLGPVNCHNPQNCHNRRPESGSSCRARCQHCQVGCWGHRSAPFFGIYAWNQTAAGAKKACSLVSAMCEVVRGMMASRK